MLYPQHHKHSRPGTIRYAIYGGLMALALFPAVKGLCWFMVWGGTLLEGWLK